MAEAEAVAEAEAAAPRCGAADCENAGLKACGRCGQEAYCSVECQRKAWRTHKLVCRGADPAESEVSALLKQGRLYSAREKLALLPKANERLSTELEEKIRLGVHSEIVDGRLRLEPVPSFGLGYIAAKDLNAGDALLFDTAFVSAPLDGKQEPHYTMAEKCLRKAKNPARRTNARLDAQADFYHDNVLSLTMKGGADPRWLKEALTDDLEREQILICSIVEGNYLRCPDDAGQAALFVAAARFNHSCAPNAAVEATRSFCVVRAAAAVPAGTELTISYLPEAMLEDAASRRQRLKGGRDFDCRCARCVAEGWATTLAEAPPATGEAPTS